MDLTLNSKGRQCVNRHIPRLTRLLKDPGVRIVNIGMACNLAIAVGKLMGGWAFDSNIIVADGWHSISDLVADLITLVTVSFAVQATSSKQPDQSLANRLGSFSLAVMLLTGGVTLGINSFAGLRQEMHLSSTFAPTSTLGTAHPDSIPKFGAAWIAIATICIKQLLYKASKSIPNRSFTSVVVKLTFLALRVAKKEDSVALESNAAHHRMDCLSAVVTLVAVLISTISDTRWIDTIGGFAVSCVIVWSGVGTLLKSVAQIYTKDVSA